MTGKRLRRKIKVADQTSVSSVWAVPAVYRGGRDNGLILAHGAGNDMTNPFLSFIQETVCDDGTLCVKFNFPYKERGGKAPDPAAKLERTLEAVIDRVCGDEAFAPRRLFLGGKSMGGRMASHLAARGVETAGLVFLGYPLHPPKGFDRLRAEHLARIQCPMLFIQGSRDSLCRLDLLQKVLKPLRAPVTLHVIEDGDHSFKVPKRTGRTEADVWDEIGAVVTGWLRKYSG
jgi:predicted alpha/beta-hydrolase family hydrolase